MDKINVGTIGHVDHGSNTLIAALTKVIIQSGVDISVEHEEIKQPKDFIIALKPFDHIDCNMREKPSRYGVPRKGKKGKIKRW